MDYSLLSIVLLVISLFLIACEVFLPSGGAITFGFIITLFGSYYCAYNAWYENYRTGWWIYVGTTLLLTPASLFGAIAAWPYTAWGRKAAPPTLEEVTPYLEEQRMLASLVGQTGMTKSLLNPAGIVMVGDKRLHGKSEGMILESGTTVRIIGYEGNRVLVREVTEPREPIVPRTETDDPLEDLDFNQSIS